MEGGRRNNDRDSDIGDDSPMSHTDDHSDKEDDLRGCDSSDEGVNVNHHHNVPPSGLDFSHSPDHITENHLSQHFPTNHPLGVLGNLSALSMSGLQNLQNFQSLQHSDVLEKLKMQVRDMKVGLMGDQDFSSMHSYGAGTLSTPPNTSFTVPQLSNPGTNSSQNGFLFTTPNIPCTKDGNPGSNSSTSSETSNSSQQNNGWSFEEQYKQVRQLYEINDDPKRKEFLDELFSFMQKRGTPINRLPIMAKSVLDLYELYNLVIARGGLVDVINKKLWQEIIKGLHLPSSITSAAFTLRTQYMKYLYPYECEKKNLSSPSELQAAIDGNRREGRRSSYGQFDSQLQGQLQLPQVQRSPVPTGMQQMSPLSLVTHGSTAGAHHRLMSAPNVGQMVNLVPHEFEARMMEYLKFFQTSKEPRRNGSQSPDLSTRDALNALEMSRVALWSMYNNNTSPPTSINTSPPGTEPQREALNLSESPPHSIPIKREREHIHEFDDRDFIQPPIKRGFINDENHIQINSSSMPHIDHRNERIHDLKSNATDTISTDCKLGQHLSQQTTISTSISDSDKIRHNGTNSPSAISSGMQFKIASRGNATKGDQQLVVSMEFNGVLYEGVLFANSTAPTNSASTTPTPSSTSNVINNTMDRIPHSIISS